MKQAFSYYPSKINDIYMMERNYELHVKKLSKIHNKPVRITESTGQPRVLTQELKNRRQRFDSSIKHQEIQKDNNRLLNKLIQISQRDSKTTYLRRFDEQDPFLHHKNFYARKSEAVKIASENERIADRIMRQEPMIKKREQDTDYKQLKDIKRRLGKYEWQQKLSQQLRQKELLNNSFQGGRHMREKSLHLPPTGGANFGEISVDYHKNNLNMSMNEGTRSYINGPIKNNDSQSVIIPGDPQFKKSMSKLDDPSVQLPNVRSQTGGDQVPSQNQ